VKPEKVVFATKEISFLGHLVSADGVRIDPERTRACRDFPRPRDVKGISRFIGMINFYHKFIPNLADVAAPLNALRKKGVKFRWDLPQQEAFETLKKLISQPRSATISVPLSRTCENVETSSGQKYIKK
jgi:hypothetical protein